MLISFITPENSSSILFKFMPNDALNNEKFFIPKEHAQPFIKILKRNLVLLS